MNAQSKPDSFDRALALMSKPVFRPIGHDAPRHSIEWTNFQAATIAARQVRGLAIHSEAHRVSLEQWERGERSWPYPDADIEAARAEADAAILKLSRGLNRYRKDFGNG